MNIYLHWTGAAVNAPLLHRNCSNFELFVCILSFIFDLTTIFAYQKCGNHFTTKLSVYQFLVHIFMCFDGFVGVNFSPSTQRKFTWKLLTYDFIILWLAGMIFFSRTYGHFFHRTKCQMELSSLNVKMEEDTVVPKLSVYYSTISCLFLSLIYVGSLYVWRSEHNRYTITCPSFHWIQIKILQIICIMKRMKCQVYSI